jgi:hypothetical protein
MQRHLLSFVRTGNPNPTPDTSTKVEDEGTGIGEWPAYGQKGNVLALKPEGVEVGGDVLDEPRVRFWNKVIDPSLYLCDRLSYS